MLRRYFWEDGVDIEELRRNLSDPLELLNNFAFEPRGDALRQVTVRGDTFMHKLISFGHLEFLEDAMRGIESEQIRNIMADAFFERRNALDFAPVDLQIRQDYDRACASEFFGERCRALQIEISEGIISRATSVTASIMVSGDEDDGLINSTPSTLPQSNNPLRGAIPSEVRLDVPPPSQDSSVSEDVQPQGELPRGLYSLFSPSAKAPRTFLPVAPLQASAAILHLGSFASPLPRNPVDAIPAIEGFSSIEPSQASQLDDANPSLHR